MRTPALIEFLWAWKMQAKHTTQVCSSVSSEQLKLSFSGIDVAQLTEGINGSVLEACQEWDMTRHVLSRVRLFATPWAVEAPLSMRFSRQAYWSGLTVPPPGGLPDPGIKLASPVSPSLQVGGSSDLRLSWSEHGNQPWSWMLCLRNPRMFPDPGPRRWARNPTGIPQPPVWWDRKGRAGRAQRAEHEACGLDHLTLNDSTIASSGEFLDFLRPHFILKKKKK